MCGYYSVYTCKGGGFHIGHVYRSVEIQFIVHTHINVHCLYHVHVLCMELCKNHIIIIYKLYLVNKAYNLLEFKAFSH